MAGKLLEEEGEAGPFPSQTGHFHPHAPRWLLPMPGTSRSEPTRQSPASNGTFRQGGKVTGGWRREGEGR